MIASQPVGNKHYWVINLPSTQKNDRRLSSFFVSQVVANQKKTYVQTYQPDWQRLDGSPIRRCFHYSDGHEFSFRAWEIHGECELASCIPYTIQS